MRPKFRVSLGAFFSMHEIKKSVKFQLSDFRLSAQVFSTLMPNHLFYMLCKQVMVFANDVHDGN